MAMRFLVIFVALLGLSQSARVLEIHVFTDPSSNGMGGLSSLDLEIVTTDFRFCYARNLQESGDTYLPGEIDVFHDQEIGECLNFDVPDKIIPRIRAFHHGGDGLLVSWYRILFDDGTYVLCDDHTNIDNEQIHTINCTPM